MSAAHELLGVVAVVTCFAEAARVLAHQLFPGAVIERVASMDADAGDRDEATEKGIGYGTPVRVTLVQPGGERRDIVVHAANPDRYGHDRRADRAQNALLAFDTLGEIPRHVAALDVGAITSGGQLHSLRDCGELYLVTEFAPGRLYADDLRRIGAERAIEPRDRDRCVTLADYLSELHQQPVSAAPAGSYRRAIRDLVGHGEGIFGIIDGYPEAQPSVPAAFDPSRLRAIEAACVDWRWQLRGRDSRLARTHGDFHPFNILFDADASGADQLTLLDASRGCLGDPADDVVCLAVNYLFFALQHPGAWAGAFRELWSLFWGRYFAARPDPELLAVAPPYLAWRVLVLCNPDWYPSVTPATRGVLLGLAERSLERGELQIEWADEAAR